VSIAAIERPPASPYGTYAMAPRRCTVCGDWRIVADGRYLCALHNPRTGGSMATPTLTAGGKAAPPKPNPADPAVLLNNWHLALTRMLELAVRYGELDNLVAKRRVWLAEHPFHEKHAERHAAMWSTAMERNELGGRVMDLCAELSRLQGQMPAGMVDGIGALLGHPLFPYAGQKWAMAAARIRTTDIFDVASWVSMEVRQNSEATEYEHNGRAA
jgi:hypothetical protein